jgi:hypothetical protein
VLAEAVGVKCILIGDSLNCTFSLLPSFLHCVYASPLGEGCIALWVLFAVHNAYVCPNALPIGLSLML